MTFVRFFVKRQVSSELEMMYENIDRESEANANDFKFFPRKGDYIKVNKSNFRVTKTEFDLDEDVINIFLEQEECLN